MSSLSLLNLNQKNSHSLPFSSLHCSSMSSTPILSLPSTLKSSLFRKKLLDSSLSPRRPSISFAPFPTLALPKGFNGAIRAKTSSSSTFAYVTGQASDSNVGASDPKVDDDGGSDSQVRALGVLNWPLFWRLLMKNKLRLVVSLLTLVCCSACTLSMPFFSGTILLCWLRDCWIFNQIWTLELMICVVINTGHQLINHTTFN